MRIKKQDLYFGAALMQVIESSEDVLINRVSGNLYRLLVLSASKAKQYRFIYIKFVSPKKEPFRFDFTKLERTLLNERFRAKEPVFVVLVCSSEYVCVLDKAKFLKLSKDPHRLVLHVETPEVGRIRVYNHEASSKPVLVPHTAFPKDVLA